MGGGWEGRGGMRWRVVGWSKNVLDGKKSKNKLGGGGDIFYITESRVSEYIRIDLMYKIRKDMFMKLTNKQGISYNIPT